MDRSLYWMSAFMQYIAYILYGATASHDSTGHFTPYIHSPLMPYECSSACTPVTYTKHENAIASRVKQRTLFQSITTRLSQCQGVWPHPQQETESVHDSPDVSDSTSCYERFLLMAYSLNGHSLHLPSTTRLLDSYAFKDPTNTSVDHFEDEYADPHMFMYQIITNTTIQIITAQKDSNSLTGISVAPHADGMIASKHIEEDIASGYDTFRCGVLTHPTATYPTTITDIAAMRTTTDYATTFAFIGTTMWVVFGCVASSSNSHAFGRLMQLFLLLSTTTAQTIIYSDTMSAAGDWLMTDRGNTDWGITSGYCFTDTCARTQVTDASGTTKMKIRVLIEHYRNIEVQYDVFPVDLNGSVCQTYYQYGYSVNPNNKIPMGAHAGTKALADQIHAVEDSTYLYFWVWMELTDIGKCYWDNLEVRGIYDPPTSSPTKQPTAQPTRSPTKLPTAQPTGSPTKPTAQPSHAPTSNPLTIFIDSDGVDHDECGTKSSPCGTISFATVLTKYSETFFNLTKIDFHVTGQNPTEVSLWYTDSKTLNDIFFLDELRTNDDYYYPGPAWSPCVLYEGFNKSMEMTFDPNTIHSMRDWFPDICYTKFNQYFFFRRGYDIHHTLNVFNNLILDYLNMDDLGGVQVLLDFQNNQLILNNCSFHNIYRSLWIGPEQGWTATKRVNAVIRVARLSVFNTSFHNIILEPSDVYSPQEPSFIQVKSINMFDAKELFLYIDNCSIINYTHSSGPFIDIFANNIVSDIREITIHNTIFENTNTASALITSSSFLKNWRVTMNIISCVFLNIDFGTILITDNLHSVLISNVYITTSQLIKDLVDINAERSSLSLFTFGDDDVLIQNVTLKYLYDVNSNCRSSNNRTYANGAVTSSQYHCLVPVQFLQNEGTVNLTDFTVLNDIEYNTIHQKYSCGIPHLCEILYEGEELDHALITNEGLLMITNFYIRGTGIHYQLLLNKGNAFIDNAVSDYAYYHDEFDQFTLNNHILFRNDGHSIFGGVLEVRNSFLYGASYVAVNLVKGSASIIDTIIQKSQTAVVASPDVVSLFIDNVQFRDIGAYYTSYMSIFLAAIVAPPLFISAQQTIIQHSSFSFFDGHGMIICSPEAWAIMFSFDISLSDESVYDITLINNSFELNTTQVIVSIQEAQFFLNVIQEELDTVEQIAIVTQRLESLRFDAEALFQFGCLICIHAHTTAHVIANRFYGNVLSDTTPFIAIDDAPHTSCLSGNIIYGYALRLYSGTVTSCYRREMTNFITSSCWTGSLGDATNTYINTSNMTDYYIATQSDVSLISVESTQSVFAAERISFVLEGVDDQNTNKYNAINVSSGKVFIFDVDLNQMMDISYHSNCDIACFQTLDDSDSENSYTLLQTNLDCRDNVSEHNELFLMSDTTARTFNNHWSAHSIDLQPADVYYPGGELYLNYSIYDAFGNQINDYDQEITITLHSHPWELNLQTTVSILNGDCWMCNQGIHIQNVYTKDVGSTFVINAAISSDELQVNALSFTVDACPSGYGASGIQGYEQCVLCAALYLSALPTTNECFPCTNVDPYSGGTSSGFYCPGGNATIINHNVWLSAVHNTEFVSLDEHHITANDTIYTSQCPPKQCCQLVGGCSLVDPTHVQSLCAANRDVTVPLCGQCIKGQYELLGTASCGDCSDTSNLMYLIPISIATLLLVIILIYDSQHIDPKEYSAAELNYKKLVRKDEIQCLSIMITKIFMYYYQSLSQILYSKGIEHTFSPILTVFDLSFNFNTNDTSNGPKGICIFPFIQNPLHKLMLSSVFILFGFFHFIWIPCLFKCVEKHKASRLSQFVPSASKSVMLNAEALAATDSISMIRVAALQLFIISCSTVLTVAFKLLSCITFPSKQMMHFYNPLEECFSVYWILGLFMFLFVVSSFMLIAYKIFQQTNEQRFSHKSVFKKLIKSYKPSTWWWEFVLFARRVTIALCTSIRNATSRDIDAILLAFLLIYAGLHVRKMPFKYTRLNQLESICLMVLILIFVTFSDDFTTKYSVFVEYFMGFAILLPFVLVLFYIIKIMAFVRQISLSTTFSEVELHKIEKAKQRAPVVIQTALDDNADSNGDGGVEVDIDEYQGPEMDNDMFESNIPTQVHMAGEPGTHNPEYEESISRSDIDDIINEGTDPTVDEEQEAP
eukprot:285242_1